MKTEKTHSSGWHGNFDLRIEPDPYYPKLIVKRPKKLIVSTPIYNPKNGLTYNQMLDSDESIFINDLLFSMAADNEIRNKDKLKTLEQLKELIDKVKNIVEEKVYDEKIDETGL